MTPPRTKTWYQSLPAETKGDWHALKEVFLAKYAVDNNPEKLWQKLTFLQQDSIGSYSAYEAQFLKLWREWEVTLPEGERVPSFLQKERFLAGLSSVLQEKVRSKFPKNFDEAMQMARAKDRKMQFQLNFGRRDHPHCVHELPLQQPPAHPNTPEDPHLELLQKVTAQLDDLSINLVQGPRVHLPPCDDGRAQDAQPLRRPPARRRELHCSNCGEDRHGMYFCPHPRRYFGNNQGRGPRR